MNGVYRHWSWPRLLLHLNGFCYSALDNPSPSAFLPNYIVVERGNRWWHRLSVWRWRWWAWLSSDPGISQFSHLRNIFASARISHIGHDFPRVRACAQIEYKSSQLVAFWPLSLRIIISFSFTFVQAYASSGNRSEDTRKCLFYYPLCPSSPFYIFSLFLLVLSVIFLSLFVFSIVLLFPFRFFFLAF